MAKKPIKSRRIGSTASEESRSAEEFRQEDAVVRADLRRIALLAGGFLVALLALAALLR